MTALPVWPTREVAAIVGLPVWPLSDIVELPLHDFAELLEYLEHTNQPVLSFPDTQLLGHLCSAGDFLTDLETELFL